MGDGHACLIRESRLHCWGQNTYGSDGGVAPFFSTPQEIQLDDVQSVAARPENQCAVSGGRVYCWGVNRMHHLNVPTNEAGQVVLQPSAVPGLTDAVEVEMGWFTQCARRRGGQWVCWGRNADRAVGVGSTERMVTTPTALPW